MSNPRILLVGHQNDEHSDYLENLLREQGSASVIRFSLAELPKAPFGWEPGGCTSFAGKDLDGHRYSGLWRRPGHPDISGFHPEFAAFTESECRDAFRGWLELANVSWLTPPSAIEHSELKLVQLETARRLGIQIPATLVTNSAEAAVRFALDRPEVIVKAVRYGAVSSERPLMAWTSLRSAQELEELDGPPVMLQERIEATSHLRVTTVLQETFVSEVQTDLLDWRAELSNHESFRRVDLGRLPEVLRGAQLLASSLSLGFSAQDWILTPEGQAIFLEANPNGQWLFLEQAHDGAIGQALVDALLELAADD